MRGKGKMESGIKWYKAASAMMLVVVLLLAEMVPVPGSPAARAEGIKPDLKVEQISAPAVLQAGQAATVTVQVYNSGGEEAEPFDVALYAGETEVGTQTVASSVYGGEKKTVSFTWTPAAAGTVTLRAVADSGNTVAESDETNNEMIKEVTVGEVPGPLALVSTTPDYTAAAPGETISPDSELSLLFNKPVEIVDSAATELTLYCNKNSATSLSSSLTSNNKIGSYDGVLRVDADNPCKVIVNLKDENNNPILKNNRIYVIKLGANVIKARDGEEYCTSFTSTRVVNLWQFNTGPVPKQVTVDGPKRLTVGRTSRMAASVTDASGKAIYGMDIVWSSSNEELASVSSAGLVTGKNKGKVTITATLGDEYYSNRKATWTIEVRADYAYKLSTIWLYDIPEEDELEYRGVPVPGSDGSVYYMCGHSYTGEYTLRAIDDEGNPKGGFKNPTITVEPVVATIGGTEYILTARDNLLLALDPRTGDTLWSVELPANIVLPLTVTHGGLVIAGCENNVFYAISPETREVRWKYNVGKDLRAMSPSQSDKDHFQAVPTVDGANRVYLVAGDTLSVVDGASGSLQWRYTAPGTILAQAGVAPDGTVILIAGLYTTYYDNNYIYALTPPAEVGGSPVVKWSRTDLYQLRALGKKMVMDMEGNVYFLAQVTAADDPAIVRFDADDGTITWSSPSDNTFDFLTSCFGLWGADNRLYTNSEIYGEDGEPMAYADDYPNNLEGFSYSYFALGEDGILYRFWKYMGNLVGVEAAGFYDLSGSEPASLIVDEDSLTLQNGASRRIVPRVLDQNGVTLSGAELVWTSSDDSLVTVADGLLTASSVNTGQAVITVSVKDYPEISAAISVTVRNVPVPAGIYLIEERSGFGSLKTEEAARAYRVEKISGQVGEALPSVSAFVYDQHGEIITTEPLTWTLADGEVASMLNYQGLSSIYDIRYDASLRGKKAGTTTLTATLKNYPALSCTIGVEVVPASYDILWSIELEGGWWKKWAQHVMGRDGKIFYVNNNQLKAAEKATGTLLWTADLGDRYGISLGLRPRVGPDGTVYVFSTTNTMVIAVDPDTGQVKWKYQAGRDGVADLAAGADSIYALTSGGKLYRLDPSGQPLWDSPLDLGSDGGGFLLAEDGSLYAAGEQGVMRVEKDKRQTLLYAPEAGETLSLKMMTPDGDLLLQQERGGAYTLVCLSPKGVINWTYALKRSAKVSCSGDGDIYLVYPKDIVTGEKTSFVFLDGRGKERCSGILDPGGVCIHVGAAYAADFTPVPGENGEVYLVGDWIYVVDDATGQVLRTIQIGDEYSLMPPQSLTVDEDGILYATCGEVGLIAIKQNAYYGQGVEIGIADRERWKGSSLGELSLKVKNTLGETKDVIILVELVGEDDAAPARTRIALNLAAGREEELPLGLRLPASGYYRLLITVQDAETGETYASVQETLNQ
ncbi:MAG: hypothetical protein PWQ97_385 [Tepidanaerobacteraceae bacterium]|nr:hypothetical protein [Tepidanaerobacteraceae bacterium]